MADAESQIGRLVYPGEIRRFVLGGNSTFTLRREASGKRLTFRVKSTTADQAKNWSTGNQDRTAYFVSWMTSGDNLNGFTYLGMLKLDQLTGEFHFGLTHKTRHLAEHPAHTMFQIFWSLLERGCRVDPEIEFWHEGACCMCGRKLTVPESIAAGIGPECAGKE